MRAACLSLLSIVFVLGCSKPSVERPAPLPSPVLVAKAQKRTVPVQVRTIGTVKSLATVAVRPRVSGQLMEAYFKEGEYVTINKKLLSIDPRPYRTAEKQAQATLAKSRALLKGAESNLKRLEAVGANASPIELDAARTAQESALAQAELDEASLESARLQLSFTTILAPIEGQVGELLVNPGNLVDPANIVPLVVIHQISPISVTFALPEAHLPLVEAARHDKPLKVEAYLRNGEPPIAGTLAFIDNTVNIGSGTVQLKGEFANRDRKLWPGQFVDVVLTVQERPDSVVVPLSAIQSGQKGAYVYILVDGLAKLRPVTVAFELDGNAVVATGLNGDETVVTEGQLRLVEGAQTSVKSEAAK